MKQGIKRVPRDMKAAELLTGVLIVVLAPLTTCSSVATHDMPSGTGGIAGGSTPAAGGGGGSEGCPPVAEYCVPSCTAEMATLFPMPICENGQRRCPPNFVAYYSCPPESCVRSNARCCSGTTGQLTLPPCGPNGSRGGCPEETPAADFWRCIPNDLPTTLDCGSLNRQACSSAGQRCHNGGEGGGTVCECRTSAEGALTWSCSWPII